MPPKDSSDEIWARATANGYQIGACEAQDSLKDRNKHVEKVRKDQNQILKLYVTWWKGKIKEEEKQDLTSEAIRDRVLCRDSPAPPLVHVKDFFRFYTKQSKGRINKHSSVESTVSQAEFFFAGFTRVTGTLTSDKERSEVYWWIRYVLPDEGDIVNETLPKYNFAKEDLDTTLLTLWTRKDLRYISERDRVEFTFLLHVYCWTGARIGAFFNGKGLRYKDIHLVQRRRANSDNYEFIWKIDQRWVKNNRNPNTVVFSAAGKEHSRLLYNDGALLLPMAFDDNALFGFNCLDDLWQQEIPPGDNELILRWNDSALEKKIVGMSMSKFREIFKSTLQNADYFVGGSVHQIRRCLGKKVDERYTEVERSQHILQSDPRIFGQSYVANCSAVDGQAAFLDEEPDHTVIDYFQGLRQFRERGAPTFLPTALKAGLRKHPEVVKLEEAAARDGKHSEASKALRSLLKSLEHRALVSYRAAWMRERRDWKILTRGKVSPEVDDNTSQLTLILPERSRIQAKMASTLPLTAAEMREAIQDIYTLIARDGEVFYLPGEEPRNGLCPVCGDDVERRQKRCRASHIHECRRKEKAKHLNQKSSSLEHCFDCTQWYVQGPQWDEHCRQHLSQLASKSCASIIHRSTLIKRAFCPNCLGTDMPPSLRMRSWDRDADVLAHMEKVHGTESCLHPLCQGIKFEDKQLFYDHQSDVHGFRRASGVPRKRRQDDTDTKEQHGEHRPCADSQPHTLHSPKKRKGGHDAAACSTVVNLCEDLDDMDDFGLPKSSKSYDDFVSQCITFSPSPSPSVNGDEALLDRPTTKFECERIADATADKTNSTVIGTDGHAERQKIQIKLNYKRPKIILRTGKTQQYQRSVIGRYGNEKGKGIV